jgi:hypothetical protein
VANLAYNAFTYSALGDTPVVGPAFRQAIRNDAPIVASYVAIGDMLRALGPLRTWGEATAAEAAAPLAEKVRAYPPGASAAFFGAPMSSAQSRMQRAQQTAPFLLLLAVVLWWRRPRAVHMLPRLRR